ncbi:uncharacterized protein I206_102017 [Kwoniella pini CBS 10737]
MSTSNSKPSITAIVAATQSNGIGLDGGLPWKLPGEMKYFARVTTGEEPSSDLDQQNIVIMGRKTWESIPSKFRPLKNRKNLIISNKGIDVKESINTKSFNSIESTFEFLSNSNTNLNSSNKIFLIGGSQLYKTFLITKPPLINRILLTRIISEFKCDSFLEDFKSHKSLKNNLPIWKKSNHLELENWLGFKIDEENEEKGVKYKYEMWTLNEESE